MRTGPASRLAAAGAVGLLLVAVLAACAPNPPARDGSGAATRTAGALPPLSRPLRLGEVPADAPLSRVVPVEAGPGAPEDAVTELERGGASWYGPRFNGRRTASGERFDMTTLTAAHRTLPFGTQVCVRSLASGRTVMVRVNDRGPGSRQRVIDVSQAAADALDIRGLGVTQVALSLPPPGSADCGEGLAAAPVQQESGRTVSVR